MVSASAWFVVNASPCDRRLRCSYLGGRYGHTAILFAAGTASATLGALAEVASLACKGLQRLGLSPNLGPGKSEAVLLIQGEGSRSVRREAFCPECPGVLFDGPDGRRLLIRIAPEYVHLGTLVRADSHELPDIRRRAHLARQALAPLRKKAFCNPCLTASEKRDLLVQRVFAKYLHGAGLWRLQSVHEKEAASEPLRSIQRGTVRALTGISSQGLSSEQVAALLDVATSEEMLADARMRSALELVRVRASAMWDTLVTDGVWLRLVGGDFADAIRRVGDDLPVPESMAPSVSLQFLQAHTRRLTLLAKRYLKSCRAGRLRLAKDTLADVSTRPPDPVIQIGDEPTTAYDDGFMCTLCGRSFPCQRACSVHMARRHGMYTCATNVTFGSRREVCRQEFWTSFRLQQHLRKNRRCLSVYWHSDLEGSGTGQGDRRDHSWQPATIVEGPQPFWATRRPV